MVGKAQKSHGARSGLHGWYFNGGFTDPLFPSRTQNSIQISPHALSGLFQPWKGSSEARNFEVINGLQHVFEKWVERCKKWIACQGRYFGKETVTAPPQSTAKKKCNTHLTLLSERMSSCLRFASCTYFWLLSSEIRFCDWRTASSQDWESWVRYFWTQLGDMIRWVNPVSKKEGQWHSQLAETVLQGHNKTFNVSFTWILTSTVHFSSSFPLLFCVFQTISLLRLLFLTSFRSYIYFYYILYLIYFVSRFFSSLVTIAVPLVYTGMTHYIWHIRWISILDLISF
jgi:hypothetical protein